ncbi:hypothetical protein IV203_029137 [Nitzschia inconspicua]|uniref:Uncharacterized protein n=1 Tax=Nitzschia inconspicua TaxID=303405 RepID=A0A9K3LQV3_9STRA|nr:hypothetical protein IV203_029137 [Nitzschia inconspicua]
MRCPRFRNSDPVSNSSTAVRTVEASATKHGLVVNCVFGDDTFRDCVPAANRAQVLHQALVTSFDYGLFVTSKVKGGEGTLVQVVVFEIPVSVRITHGWQLATLEEPPSLAQPSTCRFHAADPEVQGKQCVADETWSAIEVHQGKRLLESREQEDPEVDERRKLSANANSQKKSPSKSPGPSQDAEFQDEEEKPGEDELEEEHQEDEREGDETDEQDIGPEEIEEQYYDDVYFP